MAPVEAYAWFAFASATVALLAALAAVASLSKARKHRSLPSRLDLVESQLEEYFALLKKMDNRDRMRAVRLNRTDQGESSSRTKSDKPDPHTNPEGWKRWMRQHAPPSALTHPKEET